MSNFNHNDSFNPFKNTKRTGGPYIMCEQQKSDIRKAIAYYNGQYAPSEGEKIIPKKYLDYLKKFL